MPPFQRPAPAPSKNFNMRNSNKILYGDQTKCQENIIGSTTPSALPIAKIFVTRTLMRDMFVVANLFDLTVLYIHIFIYFASK